jgi:hypothetical protein
MKHSETTATFPDSGGAYSYFFELPFISNGGLLFVRVSTENFLVPAMKTVLWLLIPVEQLHMYYISSTISLTTFFRGPRLAMAFPYLVLDVETIPHGSFVASTMLRYGTRLREDYTRELSLDFIFFCDDAFRDIYTVPRLAIGYQLDIFRGALFVRLTYGEQPAT